MNIDYSVFNVKNNDCLSLDRFNCITKPSTSIYGSDCSICLEPLKVSNKCTETVDSVSLPCSHSFHKECIEEWVTKHMSFCPNCKTKLK